MRSRLLICALLAAIAAAVAVPAADALRHPGFRYARAQVVACHHALDSADRFMTIAGYMRSLRAGDRMEMRFDLFRREGGRFVPVTGPGLGVWNRADAGVERYRYRKRVENLAAPARYRARVRFRWSDDAGHVTASTLRTTRVCFQPDLRPDLRVGRIGVAPGPTAASRRYTVFVRNDGPTAAGPFDVSFSIAGAAAGTQAVDGLAAGTRRRVVFTAQRCETGAQLMAVADSGSAVDERREGNDSLTVPCP